MPWSHGLRCDILNSNTGSGGERIFDQCVGSVPNQHHNNLGNYIFVAVVLVKETSNGRGSLC